MEIFKTTYIVKWADVDPYMHLRNSVYLDLGDHTRIAYFKANNYPFSQFIKSGYGPVILKTSSEYLREVLLDDKVTIDCFRYYLSEDYKRWGIQHNIRKEDQSIACILKVEGGFLDLKRRKLTIPEEQVKQIMQNIPTI
ncbi:acyl-CoA thioesterase [Flavobacteriaceae bacterium M23B6Z8]